MTVILFLIHLIKTRVFLKKTSHAVDAVCQLWPAFCLLRMSPSQPDLIHNCRRVYPWFSFFLPREASCIAATVKGFSLDVPFPSAQHQALACDCRNSLAGFRLFYDGSLMKTVAFPWKSSSFNQLVFPNKEQFVKTIPVQFSCLLPQLGL